MEEVDAGMVRIFQPQTNRSLARWQGINHLNEHITRIHGLPLHVLQRNNPAHAYGRILPQPANLIHLLVPFIIKLTIQPPPIRQSPPPA